jgi:hypothetical protein
MRKVYFISKDFGAQAMRGTQMATALRELCGVDAQVRETADDIRDAIVIFVKHATPEQVEHAQNNDNIVVVDVVDRFAYKMPIEDVLALRMADYLVVATTGAKQVAKGFCPDVGVVLHHWDPRLEKSREKYAAYPYELRFGYIGMEFNHAWKGLAPVLPVFNPDAWLEFAGLFTCHFSVRDPNDLQGKYKPPTKLVTAAALEGSNIVLAREPANLELLDGEYPYYVDDTTPEAVIKTMEMVYSTFNGSVWWGGVMMLRDVRERTDLRVVCKEYETFLEGIS